MPEFMINGIRLEFPSSIANPKVREKLRSGEYEHVEAQAAQKRVKLGHRVLELGAGLGYVTAMCAKRAGPENVMSVEANPNLLPVIRNNLDLNGCQAVTLRHGAVVGDTEGNETLPFYVGPAFWGSSLIPTSFNEKCEIDVPLLSVHNLLSEHRSNVVMMDIEGAEAEMFGKPWPEHVEMVMMELHPKVYEVGTIKRIFDCLSQTGLSYDPGVSFGDVICLRRDV